MLDEWEQAELERIVEEIANLSVGQKFVAPLPWEEIGEEPEVPMDLFAIKENLADRWYDSPDELFDDLNMKSKILSTDRL